MVRNKEADVVASLIGKTISSHSNPLSGILGARRVSEFKLFLILERKHHIQSKTHITMSLAKYTTIHIKRKRRDYVSFPVRSGKGRF